MYNAVVRRLVRKAYGRMSGGDHDAVLRSFSPAATFRLSGDHALGGEIEGVEGIRRWFERFERLFPGAQLTPETIAVSGWPARTVVATRFTIGASLADGQPYHNEGVQLLWLRWGRVVQERLYEDTQALASALEWLADRGNAEAAAAPLGRLTSRFRPDAAPSQEQSTAQEALTS